MRLITSHLRGKRDQMSSTNNGYTSIVNTGGGGSSSSVITGNWTNNSISSAVTLSSAGSGCYTSPGITTYSAIAPPTVTISNTTFDDAEITIRMKDGSDLRVAKSINLLLEHLMLIVPDDRELESNPALKMAYENYRDVRKKTMDPKLVEAYDSYQMIKKLSKEDD
jgi:hypothetical protein